MWAGMTSHSSGPVLMDVEERGSSRKEIGGSTQEEVPEPGGDGGHSAATVQRRLNVQMKTMGPSSPALLSFLSNPEARRHLLTISAPESITLSAQQLQAVQGSVFGSPRNKLASQPTTAALQELLVRLCSNCQVTRRPACNTACSRVRAIGCSSTAASSATGSSA